MSRNRFAADYIYEYLNQSAIWLRCDGGTEIGHSALYLPHSAVLRLEHSEESVRVATGEILAEIAQVTHSNGTASVHPAGNSLEAVQAAVMQLHAADPGRHTLLFEGYFASSANEHRDRNLALAHWWEEMDPRHTVIHPDPQASDRWNDKTHFRSISKAILGDHSVPHGFSLISPQFADVQRLGHLLFERGAGSVILKRAGGGGLTNHIWGSAAAFTESDFDRLCKADLSGGHANWMSVEAWIPWEISGICSFFASSDHSIRHMHLAQQMLSPKSAGFIGSQSWTSLSEADQEAVILHSSRLVEKAYRDGIEGFCGVDFVVCAEGVTTGIPLPSRRKLLFIEATPRIGGHNQESKLAAMVAHGRGIGLHDMAWARVGNRPWAGVGRDETYVAMKALQRGQTTRLIASSTLDHGPCMLLDCNHRKPSIYDAIFLACRKKKLAGMEEALRRLDDAGVLRT